MSRRARIVLIVLGLVVVLGGLFPWTVEDEVGSGLDFSLRPRDGQTAVYEAQAGGQPVFVGSRDGASEYMERRRAAGESFVVPGTIIAAGAILVIVGAFASRRTDGPA
jgi:hypothetical protein